MNHALTANYKHDITNDEGPPSSGSRRLHEAADSCPAEVASRFKVKREIGRGGMCAVYEAEHRYTRRSVAIKLLLPAAAKRPEMRARLLREASALGRIRHEGVIQVLDAGVTAQNDPFVVLELMDGRTLDGILASRGTLSVADAVHVTRKIAAALDACHRKHIIHRDIKPGNVFIVRNATGSDGVRVADFGLAYVHTEESNGAPKLTGQGIILGTPEYMAPEQLMSMPVTPKSDIWALGVLLHECLTGTVPYVGNYYDVLLQATSASTPVVNEQSSDIPPALAKIINRALSRDSKDRFESASDFLRALDATGLASTSLNLLSGTANQRKNSMEVVKRAHARASFVTPVRIDTGDAKFEGRGEDISNGGMMILTNAELAHGSPVKIVFSLPGTGRLTTVSATVRWTRKADATQRFKQAVGLEFFFLEPEAEAEIRQYVQLMQEGR